MTASTQVILPSTPELVYGALAFVILTGGLLVGTVLLVRWFGRTLVKPAPRPPCSFGPHCPCDCHQPDD